MHSFNGFLLDLGGNELFLEGGLELGPSSVIWGLAAKASAIRSLAQSPPQVPALKFVKAAGTFLSLVL